MTTASTLQGRPAALPWAMLAILASGFALSQAFRTITAIIATGLQSDFGLTPEQLGLFAGAFAFAFGCMQLFMGVGIDVVGIRRTILWAFPVCILGSVLSAFAPSFPLVLLGQILIGIGCAPAFLVCTVFIARHFPSAQFAMVSGLALAVGGMGMLFTGSPLAWLVAQTSWRTGFGVLAVLAALAWLLMAWKVREPALPGDQNRPKESITGAVRGFGALLLIQHTWGILALALVTYASFLALRGLWLGPLLIERHGVSLVHGGHIALLTSLLSLISPTLFGKQDPGELRRRRWLVGYTLVLALLFLLMGLTHHLWIDVGAALAIGWMCGYMVLQYADVRSAYPAHLVGRAMGVFTMAMFLGVAWVQWLTGWLASWAIAQGWEPYRTVLCGIAALLLLGALAFVCFPQPPRTSISTPPAQ